MSKLTLLRIVLVFPSTIDLTVRLEIFNKFFFKFISALWGW